MKMLKLTLFSWILIAQCSLNLFAIEPYRDTSLTIDARVDNLISLMTLEEKISQLGNKSNEINRLGISSYNYWNEAIHGVARSGLATSFPVSIALSSTWNPELVYEVATAISDEARIYNNTQNKGLTYWSPTINLARDPRWGRSEENYGEDVLLTSKIAVSFIKGMQGNNPKYLKTVATAKHFACNNIEANRYGISSNIDERNLREYYLPAFKACVEEAGVYSVMSAYNAVNGVPSPTNRTLLTKILRDEWGFNGFVVSDCDAVYNVYNNHKFVSNGSQATAISLINGNDLNCGTTFPDNASSAISSGILTEADIDTALKRIFKARFLLGEFDPPSAVSYTSISVEKLDSDEHKELALRSALESIVLLKNDNSFLPLQKDSIETIAIVGPNANVVQLGGYSGSPSIQVSPVKGIADLLGINIFNGVIEAESYIAQSGIKTESSEDGGSNIGYINNGDYCAYDTFDFSTGKTKIDFRIAGNSPGTIEVILDEINGTSLGSFAVPSTGGWQTWQTLSFDISGTTGKHKVYLKFSGGSGYLFNLNWFKIYNEDDVDPLAGEGAIRYAAGCSVNGAKNQTEFDKAVTLAQNSDIAIVVCGTDLSVADESHDRSSISLPGVQEELIEEVYRVNPNTVVVLVTGASLAVNWAQDSVPAIICSWYNGQSQGEALADVLFGNYNPGGKLSSTWYKSTSQLPAMDNYNIRNNRTYMYFMGTPLYPFGYGLSYTDFSFSNLIIDGDELTQGDSINLSVDVTNTGDIAGDEVVQFYVHIDESSIKRPIKELKGFKRVHLDSAETQTVSFTLKYSDLQYFDMQSKSFKVENKSAILMIGNSSEHIYLTDTLKVSEGFVDSTYVINPFKKIEAEHLEGKSLNPQFVANQANGLSIRANAASHICYKHLNFDTEAFQLNAYIASAEQGATIDVVLDSINGENIGSLHVKSTGDMNTYDTLSCVLSGISGIRDVYLLIDNVPAAFYIDWINFQNEITVSAKETELDKNRYYHAQLFPNPTKGNFTLKYYLPETSDVELTICSLQGSTVFTQTYLNQSIGEYLQDINTAKLKLSVGTYIVNFKTKDYNKSLLLNMIK